MNPPFIQPALILFFSSKDFIFCLLNINSPNLAGGLTAVIVKLEFFLCENLIDVSNLHLITHHRKLRKVFIFIK